MSEAVRIKLGGEEYGVLPLAYRQERKWRQEFGKPLEEMIELIATAPDIEISNMGDFAPVLKQMGGLLLGATDTLIDAFFAYARFPEHVQDEIEENATSEELLNGLWEVLKLAYPFGAILSEVSGASIMQTSTSSHSQNGAGKRTRSQK